MSLGAWLTVDFFKRHISRFKKRPIAWQIQSSPRSNGNPQPNDARRSGIADAAMVAKSCGGEYRGDLCLSIRTAVPSWLISPRRRLGLDGAPTMRSGRR